MPRGGAASRSQRGILLWSLLATPACGLIVGFEPRGLEESSESTTSLGAESSNDGPTGVGGSGGSGPTSTSEATANGDTESTTGNSDSGGEANTDVAESASSTAGNGGSSAGNGGTGEGGTESLSTSGGGSGGDGSNGGGSGSDGSSTTNATTGGNGGSTTSGNGGVGGGGSGSGGTGGDTVSSTTSGGGSGSAGTTSGSGGTGGIPLCEYEDTFDASENAGVYPAALMLGRDNSARPWDITWVENDQVYVAARDDDETPVLGPTRLDTGGAHNTSVIATQGTEAIVAYGEFASDDARIVLNRLTPLTFDDVTRDATDPLGGDVAPRVLGIAMQGTTDNALVAAIGADGAGILAAFTDTVSTPISEVLPGSVDALVPFDLDGNFGLAYIEEGSLKVSLATYDLDDVAMGQEVPDAAPSVSSPHALGAASMSDGAALVWEQENGIWLTTLDSDGDAENPVQVSSGQNDVLPRVDVIGDQLFVSWIDANVHKLYLRRFSAGLTGDADPRLMVADMVAESSYGLATDRFSVNKTLALVYATERLKLTIISCP